VVLHSLDVGHLGQQRLAVVDSAFTGRAVGFIPAVSSAPITLGLLALGANQVKHDLLPFALRAVGLGALAEVNFLDVQVKLALVLEPAYADAHWGSVCSLPCFKALLLA